MIEVLVKPDEVSWDEISDVIYRSHSKNREMGVDIRNAHLTGDEMKDSIGDGGVCFIARETGTDSVIASCSVAFEELDRWYAKGKYAYFTLEGVLPEYAGQRIYSRLSNARFDFIKNQGCKGAYMRVAEENILRRKIAKKEGFIEVAINKTKFNPHYYLTFVKWFDEKPHSILYVRFRFFLCKVILSVKELLGIIN